MSACVLCNSSVDDTLQFGEKFTCEDTTAHLYCLLLTSNLVQNGEENEGISGFMPIDIKKEVSRTKKLFCHYCKEKGATIGCCLKSCRHSFHLPCALENDCRLEFTNTFRSFCNVHHNIKTPKHAHKPTDLCTICYDEMGKYNPIRSIPLPCCNKNAWCHKLCLQQYAQTSGYFLKCPLCKDSNGFRKWIAERGVFIPDRDAKWEIDEGEPNTFYGFEQHSERPSECEAKVCKCRKGRSYQKDVENDKHSLVYCHYCGSHAAHLGCIKGEEFLCEECTTIAKNVASTSSTANAQQGQNSVNAHGTQTQSIASGSNSNATRIDDRFKHLLIKYNIKECSILLRQLTSKDLGFTLEPNDTESDTANSSSGTSESSDTQTDASSSEESAVRVLIRKNKRAMVILSSTSESDIESEIDVKPAKRTRIQPRNQFFESDSDSMGLKLDINDNSKDMPFSSVTANKPSDRDFLFENLRAHQYSTSEEGEIRPTGTIRKPHISDSSDDQKYGKENEKPQVAVVRPFSRIPMSTDDSFSDESIKPVKLQEQSWQQISSSDEASDGFSKPSKDDQFLKKFKQETNTMESEQKPRQSDQFGMNAAKYSPSKKKRRTVTAYFGNSSSSDEEPIQMKPKRKSPKSKQRPVAQVAPNQSTIMDFFKKQFYQNN